VSDVSHRKEIVAGGIHKYLHSRKCLRLLPFLNTDRLHEEYMEGIKNVADSAGDFFDAISVHRADGGLTATELLEELFRELPQVRNQRPLKKYLLLILSKFWYRLCSHCGLPNTRPLSRSP
jgi:hypothetical protein